MSSPVPGGRIGTEASGDEPARPVKLGQISHIHTYCTHKSPYSFTSFAGFWYPARKHLYFISVSGKFLGTSLPPTPNWSRFDLFIDAYSIFFVIVFLATHCILFIFYLPFQRL